MNNCAMFERNSSHEGVGRHKWSYCTKSEVFKARTRSVGATRVGGVISSEEESAATGGK